MRATHLSIVALAGLLSTCVSPQEQLAKKALVSMQQAVTTAESSVPGSKAKQAHLESEDGRTVYEVEMVDAANNTRTVWVDAETGRIAKTDR